MIRRRAARTPRRPSRHGRHGREGRSPVVRPPLLPLETREERFVEACRRLGTDPGRTLYVGDELDIDATAARRAGLRGVWLDRPGTRRGGVHLEDPAAAAEAGVDVVTTLDALPGLLAARPGGVLRA